MNFKNKSKVFYPSHGAGWVKELKTIEFNGVTKEYYEFEFINKTLTISTPVDNVQNLGVRAVCDSGCIKDLIKTLKSKPVETPPVTDYNNFIELLKELDDKAQIESFIKIIQYCNFMKRQRETDGRLIPVGITRYIKNSASHIISELAVASDLDYKDAEKMFCDISGLDCGTN